MPLTKKGKTILTNMKKQYGAEEGERVFYKSANSHRIKGVHRRQRRGSVITGKGK